MFHAHVSFIELQSGRRQRSTLAFARRSSFGSSKRCFRDSTEQLEEHVQDMHECRRTFLFAPYALVRSNSMWKQRGWHQPQHSSPNVWCRLHCETATEHLATLLCDSIAPIRQTATEHRPNGAILCEDCDEADHSVLCHATGHAHMVHAARIGSVPPLGQCLRSRSWQPLSG